jgi:anti-sigma-K factor RskA
MSVHEQFADDLALYALGALQGDDRTTLEKHLELCASCRRELDELRGDMALMALSTAGPAPPQRAKQRLIDAVRREPRTSEVKVSSPSWWGLLGWVAAAVMAVVAIWFWRESDKLSELAAGLKNEFVHQQDQLRIARSVVETLTAKDAQTITVLPVSAQGPPPPQGRAIYVKDRSSLVFMASNMPELPAQKAYELWLIPKQGAPIPAGVFKPDAKGSAVVINPPLPPQVEAKAFAITIEPEQGSTMPTMPIKMMGN